MLRRGDKRKGTKRRRRRRVKLARLAAAGALVAWIVKQKKSDKEPEGVWKDIGPS